MAKRFRDKLGGAWAKISGKEKREREEQAAAICAEHERRADFGADECSERLKEVLGEKAGMDFFAGYIGDKLSAIVQDALADRALSPDEDAAIKAALRRYGNPSLDAGTMALLDRARALHHAMTTPLSPVDSPLLLKRGEFCVFGIQAEALEERSKTVRVNYAGPTARIKIAKGLYYSAGSLAVNREQREYHHSFGHGALVATNKRILWASPGKTISITLPRIMMFEPYNDGIKIYKDSGKPIMFQWPSDKGIGSVYIGRAIEELRD